MQGWEVSVAPKDFCKFAIIIFAFVGVVVGCGGGESYLVLLFKFFSYKEIIMKNY